MAANVWKGSLTFGLVNIPVVLHSAIESAEEVSFHMLDKRDDARIQYRRVNAETGEEVDWENIVKGYEYEKGKYVVLSKEDFDSAKIEADESADILGFVDRGDISPQYFEQPYFLAPMKTGIKGYVLLREALSRADKVGIVRITMRVREYMAALVVSNTALVLNTLRYDHELRTAADLNISEDDVQSLGLSDKEVRMAEKLVSEMHTKWDPSKFKDAYANRISALVEAKMKGKLESQKSKAKGDTAKKGEIIDLMELLQKSVGTKSRASAAKKAPAPKKKKRA
jgi:DNA end-binding protein Ku